MVVALIPARGGSKRLPRKNVLPFAGRPLIYYSIALARRVKAIDRCVVSTDDREIAAVSRSLGAEIVDRPAGLAGDHVPTVAAVAHAIDTLEGMGGAIDAVVLLQPNCPLRPESLVDEALARFATLPADSVVSVTRHTHKTGVLRDGFFIPAYEPGTRSQDLPESYYENGLVYVTRPATVRRHQSVFGERIVPVVTDPLYAMGDIDTPLDLSVAEFLFRRYRDRFDWVPIEACEGAVEAALSGGTDAPLRS